MKGEKGVSQIPESEAPALLVSYYYLEPFLKNQSLYRYRDWVMDSGAFSAANSGKHIDLNKYIDCCLELRDKDPTLAEVFSLDVIPGDMKPETVAHAAEQSEKNCAEMWRQGVPAMPTFHAGEPEEFLYNMAKQYPKIALGGVALKRGDFKLAWLEQCFARVWPKKIHGLGMSGEAIIYALPFHSVDATNWEIAPCAFGNWQKFGSMSVRGSNQDLRSQVQHYLAMEAKARVRWKKEMAQLEAMEHPSPKLGCASPTVRLAMRSTGREVETFPASSATSPSVRLALDAGAAGGKHAKIAFQKSEPPLKPVAPAPKPQPTEKKVPGEMKPEVVDYWKNRFAGGR